MSPFANVLNSYNRSNTVNVLGFTRTEMSSNFMDYDSKMVQSMFITSDQRNNHGLFSSSPHAYYQDSHFSSSSFGFNNSQMVYGMRENMVSTMEIPYISQVPNNPHLSQISITQTITKSYSAIVPTNHLINAQNDYNRPMNPNIFNSSFYPRNLVEEHSEILDPTPINTVFADQYQNHSDMFSFTPRNNHDQHVPHRRQVNKRRRSPARRFEDLDTEEDGDQYDGRTHSLPYTKHGPYTCPKCKNVFDTSQKFAAHVASVHYKNETIDEKIKRIEARSKKRRTNQMIHEEEESGGHINIPSDYPESFSMFYDG